MVQWLSILKGSQKLFSLEISLVTTFLSQYVSNDENMNRNDILWLFRRLFFLGYMNINNLFFRGIVMKWLFFQVNRNVTYACLIWMIKIWKGKIWTFWLSWDVMSIFVSNWTNIYWKGKVISIPRQIFDCVFDYLSKIIVALKKTPIKVYIFLKMNSFQHIWMANPKKLFQCWMQ